MLSILLYYLYVRNFSKKPTLEFKEQIIELRNQGNSFPEIGNLLGFSEDVVYKIARHIKLTQEQRKKLI